jgi:flavodoxin
MAVRKTLVVYYSRTGTTRKVAQAIADMLECDAEEVVDTKDRAGVLGFIGGGKDASLGRLTAIGPVTKDPGGYELVLIGTPVWAWTMAPAVRTYISQHRDSLPAVAFFATAGGTGMERTFRRMEELCGRKPRAVLGLVAGEVLKGDPTDRIKAFVEAVRA